MNVQDHVAMSHELLSSIQSIKFGCSGYLDSLLPALYEKAKRQQSLAFETMVNK